MANAPPVCDWQTSKREIKNRADYLLQTGKWSDCCFVVGNDPHQQTFECHKLVLAMASPVFEAMFFGGMAEKDPIAILDVQPDAFKALLEYIYTDRIDLVSFDQACEICYVAKKYMLPHLVESCTQYLWRDLNATNACRAYEFAKLFEEPTLMDKCLEIMCTQTHEVINHKSFEEVELRTIITILDQNKLSLESELELFTVVASFADRLNHTSGAKVARQNGKDNVTHEPNSSRGPSIRDALSKIRFLTLKPKEFAESPGTSNLLSQSEKFAILMNISSQSTDVQMPPGFSSNKTNRCVKEMSGRQCPWRGMNYYEDYNPEEGEKTICTREPLAIVECMNSSVFDCSITFSTNENIWVYGIKIPAQIHMSAEVEAVPMIIKTTYNELIYAHLLDYNGSRLTYTHFTSRVDFHSVIEISFNKATLIMKNKLYKIGVVLNKVGWYPAGSYPSTCLSNNVLFKFEQGPGGSDLRDGLIRSIIYRLPTQFFP